MLTTMGTDGAERRERLNKRLESMDNHLGPVWRPKPVTTRGWIVLAAVTVIFLLVGGPWHAAWWLCFVGVGLLTNFAIGKWQSKHDSPGDGSH
jgi:hypothetical protein